MENIIRFKNVSKFYGSDEVLSDISLNISKGEIFGLLGPSGAGKTTILKIITGQQNLSSGEADILGYSSEKLNDSVYLKMGMVLDNCGLYERLNAYENLYIFSKITGVNKSRIYHVLEQVELLEYMKKNVNVFSKGMKQRLAFARAILHQPEILFLDEPITGLDPATAEKLHCLILSLRENGTTVFLTTHNMEEATKLCDNIALIHCGKIIEYGSPKKICEKYNFEQNIHVGLKNGREVVFKNNEVDADKIHKLFKEGSIKSIHSSEPNLEKVFIHLTGRKLI